MKSLISFFTNKRITVIPFCKERVNLSNDVKLNHTVFKNSGKLFNFLKVSIQYKISCLQS